MWKIARIGFGLIGLLGTVLPAGHRLASSLAQTQTVPPPVKLFSILYGEKEDQLGVKLFPDIPPDVDREGMLGEGPATFCVSWDGNLFYFLDTINSDESGKKCFVKVFNRQGRLVRKIVINEEWASYMTVAPNGTIYLRGGGEFAVFDAQGDYQKELSLRLTEQCRSAPVYSYSAAEVFTTDLEGNVYMGASELVSHEGSVPITEPKILRLSIDPNGTYKILPYGVVDRRGYIWELVTEDPVQWVTRRAFGTDGELYMEESVVAFKQKHVTVYDTSGRQLREFQVPAEPLNEIERGLTVISWAYLIDGRGHILMFMEQPEMRWYTVVPIDLEVLRPIRVMEYDERGRRVGLRAIVGLYQFAAPGIMNPARQWDVDRWGKLYYLDFKADRVDVMMVRPLPERNE